MDRWAAASRANVPPFHVMDLLAAAAERQRTHGDLRNLLAGQPSTGAPEPVRAEAVRLLQSGDPLGYTPATGILELREAAHLAPMIDDTAEAIAVQDGAERELAQLMAGAV